MSYNDYLDWQERNLPINPPINPGADKDVEGNLYHYHGPSSVAIANVWVAPDRYSFEPRIRKQFK